MEQFSKVPRVSARVGGASYAKSIFEKHEILSLPALRELTKADLEGLGVSVGHAMALISALSKPVQLEPLFTWDRSDQRCRLGRDGLRSRCSQS